LRFLSRFGNIAHLLFKGVFVSFFAAFMAKRPSQKMAVATLFTCAALLGSAAFSKARAPEDSTNAAVISQSELPSEATQTLKLIGQGGPFPYTKDGVVFGNRERILPKQTRGYYHEYTVKTPGSHNRGAHRIVCGGWQVTQPDACFYTADHYASFSRIVP
jgi:ribonuclease T1